MKTKQAKSRKSGGPFKVVTEAGVSVSIYHRRVKKGKGRYDEYLLADYSTGTRRLRSFADEQKATDEAKRVAVALSRGEVTAAALSATDAASYGRAVQLIRETGLSLEVACSHFAEAVKLLGSDRVIEAARFLKANDPANLPSKTVKEAVDELLEVRENAGRSTRHVQDLRHRLNRLAGDFANIQIATVTTPLIQGWLDGIKGSEQSRKNFRTVAGNLFKFAVARGYMRSNPVEGTEKPKPQSGAVEIYKPGELAKLIAHASKDFLPALVLGAFAGIRTAELWRLEWADVDLKGGHVTVAADKAKTASRRLVPIQPNLGAWLAPYAKRTGPVWPGDAAGYYEAAHEAAAAAKVEWKDNGLRHSYASYRLATVKQAGQVALELGNTAEVVFRHYREIVTEKDGKAWFTLAPRKPANVASIKAA